MMGTSTAFSPSDWERLWKPSNHPFPFRWGQPWNACVEYRVDDFAADVGFFIDVLGFPVNAFDPDYAMLTSPGGDFYFAITPARPGESATHPDALRLQFMVVDILDTTRELISRGIFFEQEPQPCQEGSSLYIGYFRTPHGICIDLWGIVDEEMDVEIETNEPGSIAYTDYPTARIHETLCEIRQDGAILCPGAKVLCKEGILKVGKNSVVGANAVLIQSIGEGEIWGGVPARLIRRRDEA